MSAALLCIAGLAALLFGAELLIRAGTTLAAALNIAPIVIGLTVVSIGTSLPELAVGINAAMSDSDGLAVGNIAGTNSFNILFILGLSAAISPLAIEHRARRIELPAMILAALALLALAWDGRLTRLEGMALFAGAVLYTLLSLHAARRASMAATPARNESTDAATDNGSASRWQGPAANLALLVISIAIILAGADWLVSGAISLSRMLGVSESLIGLTVIAIGTSSPELVTTLVATLRHQRDIAVGNLLGSSIYNILFILGVTIIAAPNGLGVEDRLIHWDIPVMVAATLACAPIFLTGRQADRREGMVMVAAYIAYLAALVMTGM